MHLSVIIPAYNEEKRLRKTLEEIYKYLIQQPYDYEILVVDNGQVVEQGTFAELLRLNGKFKELVSAQTIN